MSKEQKSKTTKKKNIWSVGGLEKRCRDLIEDGILLADDGESKLCEKINSEFAEQFEHNKLKLSQQVLSKRVPELIWTAKVSKALWRAVSHGLVPQFRRAHSYIREADVTKKIKSQKGFTKTKSVTEYKAGMGRLSTDDMPRDAGNYEFPHISYEKPYVVSTDSEGQIPIINGALTGIKYPDIERNTLRRALADARKRGAKAVILTNVIELWTKKTAGPLAALRATVSGLQINPDRFPTDYRQEVQDILDGKIQDKLIYQTLNERFNEIMDGLNKITNRPEGKGPEFPGQVLVILGLKEEELIYSGAYYECRYMTIIEQNRVEAELNSASSALAETHLDENDEDVEYWDAEVTRLSQKKARTILSNIADTQYEFYRRRMRALVVKRFEEMIPNCKVISQGSTHLKIDDKIVKIHIPHDDHVSDGLLDDVAGSYGLDVFHNTLADLTISCHPYSLNHRLVGREDSKDGQPVTKFMHVAPSALDIKFLREEFKDITKTAHPVQRLVFDPQVKPGVLLLSWANGMINAEPLPIEKLNAFEEPLDMTNFSYPYPDILYITVKLSTDNHYGSVAKREIWDPVTKMHLGTDEAANEFLRRLEVVNSSDLGVHMYAEMDDATDGCLWFQPHFRTDPQAMTVVQSDRWLRQMTADLRRAIERGDSQIALELADEIHKTSIAQLYFSGDHFPFNQMMQVYDRHIDPQIDVYSSILGRFKKSGLEIRGISQINRSLFDTRDLGVLNFPNGNHRINTMKGADLEGEYFARHLQAKLGQLKEWRGKDEYLREKVRAPRFANITCGWGTIQAPGRYPWGIRIHNAPAKQSGWSDILREVIKSDLKRGDDSYGLSKFVTVTFYGDRHFYAKAETERMIYVMCAAGVHTDTYGTAGGFPPNNTGVCFVSLPADGPETGPIIMRTLTHDFLRDWFANPKPFDMRKFLPKAV